MSRRKQSKPRQIKRSIGDLDGGEETTPGDLSLSGEEGGTSDQEDSAGGDGSSPAPLAPLHNEEPRTESSRGAPDNDEDEGDGDDEDDNYCDNPYEEEEAGEEVCGIDAEPDRNQRNHRGPGRGDTRRASDDLDLGEEGEEAAVVTRRDLRTDTLWGPFLGFIQSEESAADELDMETKGSRLTLLCEDSGCWLNRVPVTPDAMDANCTIYSQGEQLFCRLSRDLDQGDRLLAILTAGAVPPAPAPCSPATSSPPPPLDRLTPPATATRLEPPAATEEQQQQQQPSSYPASLHSDIQLLPQQAGMAAILATAVINKDIFPCKDCGIWYRSERNLQAHLMYYCASRQKQQNPGAAATATATAIATATTPPSPPLAPDRPKETYPNERICPFPQCSKSCPSASSLEIHMRTHSGERPFVCLVCLSAFTTKANCERHLKVHTDTLSGLCHGCGFVSATRDILYSHLVTSHMVCQPGSRSEVYSPGPGMPNLQLASGLSPGDSGVVLKCQLCGHNCDNPAQLQQHVRTHLELHVQTERSPTPRQTHLQAAERGQRQPSPQGPAREPAACVPRPDSSSPGANGGSATPRGFSPPGATGAPLCIKEEPRSEEEEEEERMDVKEEGEERGGETFGGEGQGAEGERDQGPRVKMSPGSRADPTSQTSTSPKSPSVATMKAEPTSPTPGSSPAPGGPGGPVLPGGVFLPQYMFNAEAAILPQASEILAKMSEMVHSRLKQGQAVVQGGAVAFYPAGASPGPGAATGASAVATPPHKGATCFECDITFNNINNFYVHKRLYCSSRHQGDAPGAGPREGPASGGPDPSSPPQGQGQGQASRAPSVSPPLSEPPAEGGRLAEIKTEASAPREGQLSSSSEGEGGGGSVGGGGAGGGGGGGGGGRHSDDSRSPASGSADDRDDDPTRTFCEACNIRFSRHDNYTVHKRFYCASRHDPSNLRSNHPARLASGAAPFVPQPIRTRKRKKMYEIHMARSEALAKATAAALVAAAGPSPSGPGLAVKRELSPPGAGASSPEGDRPIDLSKRPRLREAHRAGAGLLPALPLTDYHKCTACSISFNSIENYLAHKTYYCPATTLQPHALEQLGRLKQRPASATASPHGRPPQERDVEAPAAGAFSPQAASALPGTEAASSQHASTPSSGARGPGAVCPYCPNRPVAGSLVEHLRLFHGVLLAPPPAQEPRPGPSPGSKEGGLAAGSPSFGPDLKPRPDPRLRRDSVNGQPRRESPRSPGSPLLNGSPPAPGATPPRGSPVALSPSRALSLAASPGPETLREATGASSLLDKASLAYHPLPSSVASAPAPPGAVPSKTPGASPLQNGNSRFCRLCNIKFSSLSTFIAHKKYYCSSHSAEHVK